MKGLQSRLFHIMELFMLDSLNSFLFTHTGRSGTLLLNNLSEDRSNEITEFFTPCDSLSDLIVRSIHVVSAPIFLTALSLELLIISIGMAIKFLTYDLFACGINNAMENAYEGFKIAGLSMIIGVFALASPFINFADLCGSTVSTIIECSENDQTSPSIRMY